MFYTTRVIAEQFHNAGKKDLSCCSYDLDLYPMSFTYELNLYFLDIQDVENELPMLRLLKVIV